MEISKGLQQEIQSVQNKLKNAIRDHQICVAKLKDDPNNADVLGRIQEIQLHIVTLGRCQKQVVERLRKEVETFKANNENDVKVSFATLLGLNNNNNITANNEAITDEISEVKAVTNGHDNVRLAAAKDDYEDIVHNGDVVRPPPGNVRKKERSISVETISGEDEVTEVIEMDENSGDKEIHEPQESDNSSVDEKPNCRAQSNFLEILGLITTSKFVDLQNRRAERKRRSTANPQFVYSNWEIPTKRKRHNYLQSAGNVPQTRQTTARLNEPSPPPTTNKTPASVSPPKSTSPPTRNIGKSLIPTQKPIARPNILRNMSESRVFGNKSRMENGNGQPQLSTVAKIGQTTNNSKTVHIPGLPLGLTIERIENDSVVCINCRNPGTLTNCDNCEANYHVSCHTISPPPPRLCPKCALRLKDSGSGPGTTMKNDELVAASYAPGVAGKAGEDPEINKTSCGVYKIGAVGKQQQQLVVDGRSVNQLLSSTFLIPISSNPIAGSAPFPNPDGILPDSSLSVDVVEPSDDAVADVTEKSEKSSFSTSLVINHQLSRSTITYVPQSQSHLCYAYQFPVGNSETTQSYFIVKKISDTGNFADGNIGNDGKTTFSTTSSRDTGNRGDNGNSTSEIPIADGSLQLNRLKGRLAESIARGWKKSTIRAIPGLNRIVPAGGRSVAIPINHPNDNDVDELSNVSRNVGNSTCFDSKQRRNDDNGKSGKFERGISNVRTSDDRKIGNFNEKSDGLEISTSKSSEERNLYDRKKCFGKSNSSVLHSMLTGNNESDIVADDFHESGGRNERRTSIAVDDDGNDVVENRTDVDGFRTEFVGRRTNFRNLSSFAEHVKLEEAHLSAPFGTELMLDDDSTIVKNPEFAGGSKGTGKITPNRRRTTEDRSRTSSISRAVEGFKHERSRPRILMRPERKSLDSAGNDRGSKIGKSTQDFVIFERMYGRMSAKNAKTGEIGSSSDTDSADEKSLTTARVCDGESVEAAIATIERTDGNRDGEHVGSSDDVDDEEIEEEEEEEHAGKKEDDEEEDQEDCPILDEDINEGDNERLGINTVSPESMQVLEQFESAMLQNDIADSTANP